MALHAIILSGGHGTRLWPASRPERPKQFLPLLGPQSMFQTTVERMAVVTGDIAPIVVAGEGHAREIGRQLAAMDRRDAVLLIEPGARDSAPAIAAAAAWIVMHDPEGVAAMVASDHHLPDHAAFADAVRAAAAAARDGAIVTFGIRPSAPSEAYGYIQPGDPLAPEAPARRVNRFAEKPDAPTARRYIAEGWLWNSGNFVFRAATLLEELDRYAPEVAQAARAAVAGAGDGPGVHRLGSVFLDAPKISIDYAVMEKTERAAVVPLDTDWSDLGAWDAVHAASARDYDGNAAPADTVFHAARNNLVRVTTGQRVALLGVEGIGVVVEGDAILVTNLSSSQGVKQIVERLAADPSDTATDPAERVRQLARELQGWLDVNALPLWSSLGADREAGAFHETLTSEGEAPQSPRRLRVQGRQTYVYALAGSRSWPGPWREAVELGLGAIRMQHALPGGGYRTLVSPDGSPADDAVMLYDQAFVLLAFAWAQKIGVWPDAETEALALVNLVLEPRRNPVGGFREADEARPWQSNPHMHLFEACMAWAEVGASPRWRAIADEIAELALSHFIDPRTGAVREFFKADWTSADGADGHALEPGHQFEWSWLLGRWADLSARDDASKAARRLYAVGAEHGVDHDRGVALNGLSDDFTVTDAGARLWPQTERIKAALRLADACEGDERYALLTDAVAAIDGLKLYFQGVPAGFWRDKLKADGVFVEEPSPASSLYHIACAIDELARRAGR